MSEIILISQFFFPSQSSTAQLMTDLALGLANRGNSVTVITGTPGETSIHPSVKVVRSSAAFQEGHSILSKAIGSLGFILGGLAYVLFRLPQQAPLLIASNPPYAGVIGIGFKILRGGEFYFLLQDIFPESAVLSGIFTSKSFIFQVFSAIIRKVCRFSNQTIVLTNSMKYFLEKKYPELERHTKITVIENWAIENIATCDKKENSFAIKYGLDQVFTVLYYGNMGRLHDISSLAETIKLLKDERIQFVCIGDGPKRQVLEEYHDRYNLQNLTLLPFQPRELISLTHTACDVSLVSLIAGAESIVAPCKLYGILSAGKAIVAISQPGSFIDLMLQTYNCGMNCPPQQPEMLADILRHLAANPQLTQRMGQNSRKLYEDYYQRDRAVKQYEQLLQRP